MARNQSEKLTPRVRALLAYADACEAVLNGRVRAERRAAGAWHQLDRNGQAELDNAAIPSQPNWRQRRIDYIRENYGSQQK